MTDTQDETQDDIRQTAQTHHACWYRGSDPPSVAHYLGATTEKEKLGGSARARWALLPMRTKSRRSRRAAPFCTPRRHPGTTPEPGLCATDSYREKSAIDSRRGGSDYWHTLVDDGGGTSGTGDGGSHHHVLLRQFSTEKQPAFGCLELLLCQVAAGAQVVELRQLLTQR